jgi:hypothetical protein
MVNAVDNVVEINEVPVLLRAKERWEFCLFCVA